MTLADELARLPILQNPPSSWLAAAGLAVALLAGLWGARRLVRSHHVRLAATPETELLEIPLEILSRTSLAFIAIVSVVIGLRTLDMGATSARALAGALTIGLFAQAGLWVSAAATAWLERRRRHSLDRDRAAAGSLGIIAFILRVAIWAIVLLLVLDNLGVDVTALIAGLGVGGIAIALAVQNILGDLFASLSITFDRPFVVGDFLIVDDYLGAVEYIGIKSTRLRSLSGEQIVISNADLLKSRLRNYGRMLERRVLFTTAVTYETPLEQIEQLPALIRRIVESHPQVRFDRSHFARHADAALEFETVFYVLSPDYNRYMDIQQSINIALHRELARRGVEFAYPTHTLHIARPTRGSRRADAAVSAPDR